MKKARFKFVFDKPVDAKIINESISPEIKHKVPKTNIEIKQSDKTIFLEITSNDTSSLRAAINSYLRWINTAINVKNIV